MVAYKVIDRIDTSYRLTHLPTQHSLTPYSVHTHTPTALSFFFTFILPQEKSNQTPRLKVNLKTRNGRIRSIGSHHLLHPAQTRRFLRTNIAYISTTFTRSAHTLLSTPNEPDLRFQPDPIRLRYSSNPGEFRVIDVVAHWFVAFEQGSFIDDCSMCVLINSIRCFTVTSCGLSRFISFVPSLISVCMVLSGIARKRTRPFTILN